MNQIARNQMRFYDLSYKLLGRVINVEFKKFDSVCSLGSVEFCQAKADTDEDYAQDMIQSPPTQELAQRICMAWTCAVALPPHLQWSLLFLWLNMTT
ncbi:auxin response factor 4-like isoform X3 [Lolium perenne]|uniref:auxin response factor 4-like isoform X3 n=1 Tax=Lolium perenne TaxID=4522 RepID=UPI003A9947F6